MFAPSQINKRKIMFDLKNYLADRQKQINEALLNILKDRSEDRIIKAMRHSLMAGGKRLRPILCLSATDAVGGNTENSLITACALEMIHTYSLIHDDLPAMDDDNLRRGKPTCHILFDEATAVLAGDALLTLAFDILSTPSTIHLPASKWLEVMHVVSHAAGYRGMIEGQMRDMASEGKQLNIDELKNLHALKTGALIKASIQTGAILGNGSATQLQQLSGYAKNIGLAFQVRDDILNVEGDPEILGKAVGTDDQRSKNTFPQMMGIHKSKAFAEQLVNDALQALENFDNKADPLRAIATYIIERNK